MTRKEFIKESLDFARSYTDQLLDKFETESEWVHQVHPDANHALWCAGHLANTDNYFISILAPEKAVDMEKAKDLFGGGSKPVADASAYPSAAKVLAHLKDRRETLLAVLDGLSEEDLDKATPDDAPEFLPTVESVFKVLSWHEGLHAGQVSIAHRGLGRPPILG